MGDLGGQLELVKALNQKLEKPFPYNEAKKEELTSRSSINKGCQT